MFDPELLASYPEDVREQIDSAIKLLALTGILERQARLEMMRIVEGDVTESADELTKKILNVRAETQGLLLLHNHGQNLLKESSDA